MNFSGQKHSLILLITDMQVQLLRWQSGKLSLLHVYGKTPEDLEAFADGIRSFTRLPVVIVTDLLEENFRYDTVVHVSGGDQKALLKRKMDFAFRNTQYRRSKVIEREKDGRRDDKILLSAISKPESVDVWVNLLLEQKFSIQAITSVAYILEEFVRHIKVREGDYFLITTLESGNNLRQTFFKNRQMLFSRLTTLTGRDYGQLGDDIHRETVQLRQYLERIQFLTYDAMLHIEVYTPHEEALLQLANKSNEHNHIEVMDTTALSAHITNVSPSPTYYFLSQVLGRTRLTNIYAPTTSTRFHDLKTLGYHSGFTATMLLLLTIAVNIPVVFKTNEKWREAESLQNQLDPLQAQYSSLSTNFPSIPASAQEMELVVLTHGKLASQVHSPVTAMNMISSALASSPGLLLTSIDWSLTEKPANIPAEQFGSFQDAAPTPLAGLDEENGMLAFMLDGRSQIKVVIEGQAYSPSSFTEAQDKVGKFIETLSGNPGVTVYASRMPTDVRTDISVSTLVTDGEIRAPFTLELTLAVAP
jgi:hypothetical protein